MSEAVSKPDRIARGTQLAEERTELATERTQIAADRTLMAWIRTSLSMISFGFTIYKFLEALGKAEHLEWARPNAPRNLGMALITVGTIALTVATIQHYQLSQRLRQRSGKSPWSLVIVVAIFVSLIGILAFIGVLLRTGPF